MALSHFAGWHSTRSHMHACMHAPSPLPSHTHRKARCVLLVKDQMGEGGRGEVAQQLVELLLEHGRMT
jgi:hypothetical protein